MIAVSSSGKSFRALSAYLAAGRSGKERDRVAWTAGRNLPTDNPEVAAKVMRATAAQNRRIGVPVYHLIIGFDPQDKDQVTRAMMERVADAVLDRLGLAEHEAVYVVHRDRNHPHVHIMVNRIHPETGRAWERWQDQPVIQRVLREQERALQAYHSVDGEPGGNGRVLGQERCSGPPAGVPSIDSCSNIPRRVAVTPGGVEV